jgi:hypothetical protein
VKYVNSVDGKTHSSVNVSINHKLFLFGCESCKQVFACEGAKNRDEIERCPVCQSREIQCERIAGRRKVAMISRLESSLKKLRKVSK